MVLLALQLCHALESAVMTAHPDVLRWYSQSADFRCLLVQDDALKNAVDRGLDPLRLVLFLADRTADLVHHVNHTYLNYPRK